MTERTIRIGMLGCGTVGSAVVRMLHEHGDDIARRAGCRVEVTRVAVRDPDRDRDVPLAPEVVHDRRRLDRGRPRRRRRAASCSAALEPARGARPARVRRGQARRHREQGAARERRRGAVRGRRRGAAATWLRGRGGRGHPADPLRCKESLAGERVTRMLGIVNGTTNYILTQMSEHGWAFDEALAEAQRSGTRRPTPPPTSKGSTPRPSARSSRRSRSTRGSSPATCTARASRAITAQDIADAARMGYVVKLLAIAELDDGEITARVHPAMIPASHPLAARPRRVQRGVHRGREGRAS